MIGALVALLVTQADAFADVAGMYAIAVEDTWSQGVDERTSRGEVTYLPNVDFGGDERCDILEFRMGREDDARLPLRFRLMRCADQLRYQVVYNDRLEPQPLTPNGATLLSGTLAELSTDLYGDDREVKLRFDAKGFVFTKRDRACLLRYPHGCIVSLPWKTTHERIRATRR